MNTQETAPNDSTIKPAPEPREPHVRVQTARSNHWGELPLPDEDGAPALTRFIVERIVANNGEVFIDHVDLECEYCGAWTDSPPGKAGYEDEIVHYADCIVALADRLLEMLKLDGAPRIAD